MGAQPPAHGEEEYEPEDAEEDDEYFLSPEDIVQHAPAPLRTRRSLSGLRRGQPPCPHPPGRFLSDVDVRRFVFRSRHDLRDTPWEREMRCRRLCNILKEMDEQVAAFDKEISEVKDARFAVAVDIKFGELHIIKLHQELIILKEFESVEDALALKVHNTEEDVQGVNNVIIDKQMDIEMHKKEIENLNVQVKQHQLEIKEIEEKKSIDNLKKEIELKGKSIKILEKTLGTQKSELLAFQALQTTSLEDAHRL
ncbi:Protein of unknown function [Gryllus bimaculatus]|nr:Protein of unknown function [Gryllus bimaculatus]